MPSFALIKLFSTEYIVSTSWASKFVCTSALCQTPAAPCSYVKVCSSIRKKTRWKGLSSCAARDKVLSEALISCSFYPFTDCNIEKRFWLVGIFINRHVQAKWSIIFASVEDYHGASENEESCENIILTLLNTRNLKQKSRS